MSFDRFSPEGVCFTIPESIDDYKDRTEPMPSRFFSAHFCFTLGIFAEEVKHDPQFYFHGEEISLAVRAYTHGYDLFHPHKVVAWHEYTREGKTKQWDDGDVLVNGKKVLFDLKHWRNYASKPVARRRCMFLFSTSFLCQVHVVFVQHSVFNFWLQLFLFNFLFSSFFLFGSC